MGTEVPSLGLRRPGCEADHSLPSNTEVNNGWSYTSAFSICLHGVRMDLQHTHTHILGDEWEEKGFLFGTQYCRARAIIDCCSVTDVVRSTVRSPA
jgi:hypothetical protein